MFHALLRNLRRLGPVLLVLTFVLGPFWYAACIEGALAHHLQVYSPTLEIHVAVIHADCYRNTALIGLAIGMTYLFLCCCAHSLR